MCNCKRNGRLYQELAQAMEQLMREHKAYKRQRKEIVNAINELAEQVEEHEAILEELYEGFAQEERMKQEQRRHHEERKRKKQRQQCKRCKAAMHRCKRCGR